MLELYRQDLLDLLKGPRGGEKKPQVVFKNGQTNVENLIEKECSSADDLWQLIQEGSTNRKIRATSMNSESSRSHLVVILKISVYNKQTQEQFQGKILLCDLAGSERLSKSQVT